MKRLVNKLNEELGPQPYTPFCYIHLGMSNSGSDEHVVIFSQSDKSLIQLNYTCIVCRYTPAIYIYVIHT